MHTLTNYLPTIGIDPADLSRITIGRHTVLSTRLQPATNYFQLWQTL